MLPTSTRVVCNVSAALPSGDDAVVALVSEGTTDAAQAMDGAGRPAVATLTRLLASKLVTGKSKEVLVTSIETGTRAPLALITVGVGKPEKLTAESLRVAGGAVAKTARKHRLRNVAFSISKDARDRVGFDGAVSAIVTGFLLASFKYEEYKGTVSRKKAGDDDEETSKTTLTLLVPKADLGQARETIKRAQAIADGQNFARTIASRPGNDINPVTLAKVVRELAKEAGLTCNVLDEKRMAELGMGGILGVGAGSTVTPPRMIVLEHNPPLDKRYRATPEKLQRIRRGKTGPPLLIVGKAITFDTGGISIKPAEKMGKMIFDKSGGMAVLGLMYAIAKLKLPIPVVGILSSAENHISDTAYRPGDILRMYNGVTVEVTNTDAEGRLVLGDALAWGIETYKPAAVLDLATLTGGVVVALGSTMAGVMANDDGLFAEVQTAADAAGEKIWRLPLGDDQRDLIKSDCADIVNSAGRHAHPLQGGAFLSHFIPEGTPWAHLDIAGVADTEKELPYYAKGSTAWGVRTLVEWVTRRGLSF